MPSRFGFDRGVLAGLLQLDRPWPGGPRSVVWGGEGARVRPAVRVGRRERPGWPPFVALGLLLVGAAALEIRMSWLQSRVLAATAGRLGHVVDAGPSPSIRFPEAGPYDLRLGYTHLPGFIDRVVDQGFEIQGQARWSPLAVALADAGLHSVYREKGQAGLLVADRSGRPLHAARHPQRVFERFEAVPPIIVRSLLFVENRELLEHDRGNPAVEYGRLGRAVLELGRRQIDPLHPVSGGSTLATQLEKVRHSPGGRTSSVAEKASQMASASLRAYLDGKPTLATRRRIVVDYLNTLPLGAVAGHGEVIGIGDGLAAWYGADLGTVTRLLEDAHSVSATDQVLAERAMAYRQALSLLLAARRPAVYLGDGTAALDERVDAYLRLLAAEGSVPPALRDASLGLRLEPRRRVAIAPAAFVDRKAADGARVELLTRLGLGTAYDLDRLDLTVRTSLDAAATDAVTMGLGRLVDPLHARELGLTGARLLGTSHPGRVTYSFTLYERGPSGNHLRVQADTFEGPLNINEGTRLELGSTAKLRTLVSYLETVEALHREFAGLPVEALRAVRTHPRDRLARWATDYLARTTDRSLDAMLEAAMRRTYSASPGETFFTGGGVHVFRNFDGADNGRVMSVREAFERSVNLVFIRLMRDIVQYHAQRLPGVVGVVEDAAHPQRQPYLERFADEEGQEFLRRFYRRHRDGSTVDRLARLVSARGASAPRVAVIFRTVRPDADLSEFADFLGHHGVAKGLTEARVAALYEQYASSRWNLQDLGYIARVHPLELWLAAYLDRYPTATFAEVVEASAEARQEAYRWLFRTRHRRAQDRAIQTLAEADAFARVHASWARLGYPFASLVPSYATAIGSSGDNPAALSELAGILLNGGLRYPRVRIESLHFAEGTPYETHVGRTRPRPERVLSPEVATLLAGELVGVVQHGTGRRVAGGVKLDEGGTLVIGGKTGTGDNRFETAGAAGRTSRVVNRTAAFVFTIGDRFFGTIIAFVPGPEAARYEFTSALPVQVFKSLLPSLEPVLAARPAEPAFVAAPAVDVPTTQLRAEHRRWDARRSWADLGRRADPVDVRRRDSALVARLLPV